ncbi:hypothetical protein CDAR_233591 [Caerostris darwini]|uniref:Uncharacterized protein n=1 Tax=Caerostris darwini TaxID=1538125 RepID=A0AAV4Q3S2_9ARAC|nr:hypothetical protein CDAR_233591 [Caerostris darwini]
MSYVEDKRRFLKKLTKEAAAEDESICQYKTYLCIHSVEDVVTREIQIRKVGIVELGESSIFYAACLDLNRVFLVFFRHREAYKKIQDF